MPSVIQARRAVALSAIAGLGVYRPPASTPSAKRLTGSDVTGVSYRVRAEHGLTTASLAAGAARAALRAAGIGASDLAARADGWRHRVLAKSEPDAARHRPRDRRAIGTRDHAGLVQGQWRILQPACAQPRTLWVAARGRPPDGLARYGRGGPAA